MELTFTNKQGESFTFSQSGPYVYGNLTGLGDVGAATQTQKSPYQDGSSYIDSMLSERDIGFDFKLRAEGPEALALLRSRVGRVFNPKSGEGMLRYTTHDIVREIPAVSEHVPSYPSGRSNRMPHFQKGTISLLCPDPYWRSLHQTTRALKAYDPQFILPVTLPATLGSTGDYTTVLNEGDVEAPVTITVSGPVTNPQITNETTGETLRINVTLSLDEILYIDTDPRHKRAEILRGGVPVRNAFGLIDRNRTISRLWKLVPGENNLSYVADKGNEQAIVAIRWNDRFVAV